MGTTSIDEKARSYKELKRELKEAGASLYRAILRDKGVTHQSLCRIVYLDGREDVGVINGYTVSRSGEYCLNLYQSVGGSVAYGIKPMSISIGTLDNIDWAGIRSVSPCDPQRDKVAV